MKSFRLFPFRATAVAILILAGFLGSPPGASAEEAGLYDGLKAAFEPLIQETELNANDGAAGDSFGFWVSIDGNTAVVSAPFDDDLGTDSGAVYVFVRNGRSWSLQAKLTASDGSPGDRFGDSVSISGDTLLVGVDLDTTPELGANSGSVYVFERSGTSWSQEAKLNAADGAAGDQFGFVVSIDGDTAVIGAPGDDTDAGINAGSAYVFVRSGTSWSQLHKLTPEDAGAIDRFGFSAAIDGDTLVVGAVFDDDPSGSADFGAAYVYVRDAGTWSLQQKLLANNGRAGDQLGFSVDISGDTVVVGAPTTDRVRPNSGSVYVFERSGTSWSQQAELIAPDGAFADLLGSSVAIHGDTVVGGSQFDDDRGGDSGSVYVFARNAGSWSLRQKLNAADGAAFDRFGLRVAIDDSTVVVGALLGDGPVTNSGSAYVFAPENLPPDCSGASPSVTGVWPPNHKLVEVSVQGVTDPDDDPITITVDRIRQDEATNGLGDGNFCPDGTGIGTETAYLRAERSGLGNGRVYTVSFTGSDGRGGTCSGSVTVCVPLFNNGSCVDDGATVDSTTCSE
ncbi:MAG TPA: FG-GAP repeat protein [Thermoanaerobaculia bacterium]